MEVSSQTYAQLDGRLCAILKKGVVFAAAEKHIVKGVSKHDPDNATAKQCLNPIN